MKCSPYYNTCWIGVHCRLFLFVEFDHYKTIRRSLISLPAIVHKFGCNGTEERLIDCYHHETISGANDYDVGIICVASASMTTSNTGITPSMSIKDATSMVESDSIINATMCYNCASDGASQQSDVLAASTISAVLCFFVFVGLVTGILILVFIRRKRKRFAMCDHYIMLYTCNRHKTLSVFIATC